MAIPIVRTKATRYLVNRKGAAIRLARWTSINANQAISAFPSTQMRDSPFYLAHSLSYFINHFRTFHCDGLRFDCIDKSDEASR